MLCTTELGLAWNGHLCGNTNQIKEEIFLQELKCSLNKRKADIIATSGLIKQYKLILNEGKNRLILRLVSSQKSDQTLWTGTSAKLSQTELETKLRFALQKKEEKLRLYQSKVLQYYYLVLFVDCLKCALSFNIQNFLQRFQFDSKYDTVVIFDIFSQKCYRLK